MPNRTVEQVLRDYIGAQVLTLAQMTAKIEALQAELAKYKPKLDPPKVSIHPPLVVGTNRSWLDE